MKFGTGGWRAVIGIEFKDDNIQRLAFGVADYYKKHNFTSRIVIGNDNRYKGEEAKNIFVDAFAQFDIKTFVFQEPITTPLVMYEVKERKLDLGIMITASHNPSKYNGVKLFVKGGQDAPVEVTDEIERLIPLHIDKIRLIPYATIDKADGIGFLDYDTEYTAFINSFSRYINWSAIRDANLPRIVIDNMYGTAGKPFLKIYDKATIVNAGRSYNFGGNTPCPTEKYFKAYGTKRTPFCLYFDGDGDRVGASCYYNYIPTGTLMAMVYWYLLEYKHLQGAVVKNSCTTSLLDKIAEDYNQKCYTVPVGFKNISAKMKETNALMGCEGSGGATFRGHILGKDSLFMGALLLEMVSVVGGSLGQIQGALESKYGKSYVAEDSMPINFKNLIMPVFDMLVVNIDKSDGIKYTYENGDWLSIRPSGTEPLVRIITEAQTKERAEAVIKSVKEANGL